MRRGRHTAAALALAAGGLGLAACGVPTSATPRALGRSVLPAPPATVPPTSIPASGFVQVTIILLKPGTNAPTPYPSYIPRQSDRLTTVLRVLLAGPPAGSNLTTAIPATTTLIGVTPRSVGTSTTIPQGPVTVSVNLSDDFLGAIGADQELAVQQVVFTVSCDLTPITQSARVLFQIDGQPQPVPIANGTSVATPVTASDYSTGAVNCTPPPP